MENLVWIKTENGAYINIANVEKIGVYNSQMSSKIYAVTKRGEEYRIAGFEDREKAEEFLEYMMYFLFEDEYIHSIFDVKVGKKAYLEELKSSHKYNYKQ